MANKKHDDVDFTYDNLSMLLDRTDVSIRRYVDSRWPTKPEHEQCTLYLVWYLSNTVRKYGKNLVLRNNPVFTEEHIAKLKKNKPYLLKK